MGPLVGAALLSGGAQLLGSTVQQGMSQKMAREQMRFQERMSSTAHEREVADLRKAGLNPLLSVNSGADGAGGAMGEAQNIAGSTVSSALQAGMLQKEMELVKANIDKAKTEKDSVDLDNFRKEAWMGIGRSRMFSGHGITSSGVPATSGLAAEIASAQSLAAGAAFGLDEKRALSEAWQKLGAGGKSMQLYMPLIIRILSGMMR